MSSGESYDRTFGDGAINMDVLTDLSVSQLEKTLQIAVSNGCEAPANVIVTWANRLSSGDLAHANLDEAARQAQIEYTRQIYIFDQLVDMAARKDDSSLLTDLLLATHTITPKSNIERDHVPQSYLDGKATGLATDEAYAIVEAISNLFYDKKTKLPIKHMTKWKKARILNHLNILEDQVKQSNSLSQLQNNFFEALQPRAKIQTSEKAHATQWVQVQKYANEFGFTPTHVYKDGNEQVIKEGETPDLSHEHTGFIVSRMHDVHRNEDVIVKIITRKPKNSFEERKRKLSNEPRSARHLAEMHARIPSWLRSVIHIPEVIAVSKDGNAIVMKVIHGDVAGDTHEFSQGVLGDYAIEEIACYIHELQTHAKIFTDNPEFKGMHPSISNVYVKKYTPDSQNRTKKFIEYTQSKVSEYIDINGIVDLMSTLVDELSLYAPLFPTDEKDRTYVLAHSNLNPSSFMGLPRGETAIIDWNRLSLSNNIAFDASTMMTFLATLPDFDSANYEPVILDAKSQFLRAMLIFQPDKQLFIEHLRVDLLYNRLPGEMLYMTNKLFAAIKANRSSEKIMHYAKIVNTLYGLMQDVHSREGVFSPAFIHVAE